MSTTQFLKQWNNVIKQWKYEPACVPNVFVLPALTFHICTENNRCVLWEEHVMYLPVGMCYEHWKECCGSWNPPAVSTKLV